MINLELLRIFVIVVQEGSITKASGKLNISQPAVTKHIKNLESQLKTVLFDRNNKMSLTKQGEKLFNDLQPIIINLEKIEKSFEQNKDIVLGTYNTMVSKILSKYILEYYKKYSDRKIIIINNSLEEMFKKLEIGEIDIIISKKVREEVNNKELISYSPIGNLENVLITKKKEVEEINLENLNNKVLYVPRNPSISLKKFIDKLNENHINVNIKRVDSSTMLELVKNSNDYGFITKEYVKNDINDGNINYVELSNFNDEFGTYIKKDNKFKELNDFIKILMHNF